MGWDCLPPSRGVGRRLRNCHRRTDAEGRSRSQRQRQRLPPTAPSRPPRPGRVADRRPNPIDRGVRPPSGEADPAQTCGTGGAVHPRSARLPARSAPRGEQPSSSAAVRCGARRRRQHAGGYLRAATAADRLPQPPSRLQRKIQRSSGDLGPRLLAEATRLDGPAVLDRAGHAGDADLGRRQPAKGARRSATPQALPPAPLTPLSLRRSMAQLSQRLLSGGGVHGRISLTGQGGLPVPGRPNFAGRIGTVLSRQVKLPGIEMSAIGSAFVERRVPAR
jgi:hypothetical protein